MSSSNKSSACIGFLTAVENAELGLTGGYLVLNVAGRPLEFHCTAPVKANRAQEILYGPTLRPFLLAEQIGQTLLAKSKLTPLVVCTDLVAMLEVRCFTHLPVAMVSDAELSAADGELPSLSLGKNRLMLPAGYASDASAIQEHWPREADALDLTEPFSRIWEALEEAQKSARAA